MKAETPAISYSEILIRFIEPLLDGTEYEDDYLLKAQAGMIAWNYCISDQEGLVTDAEMKKILKQLTETYPEAKKTLNMLVLRKHAMFSQYNQFIFKVEVVTTKGGNKSLRVESAPGHLLK